MPTTVLITEESQFLTIYDGVWVIFACNHLILLFKFMSLPRSYATRCDLVAPPGVAAVFADVAVVFADDVEQKDDWRTKAFIAGAREG